MSRIEIPRDFDSLSEAAWRIARNIPGFLTRDEARFIALLAACTASTGGHIVEIGSFKGRSTVMLATVAKKYGLPPVIAIDPHTFHSTELQEYRAAEGSSYEEFLNNLQSAGVSESVEVHRAFSGEVGAGWNRPIGFLWIDGDHSYAGARLDFDSFSPHVVQSGFIALHDALHEFAGPIRVFTENILPSDRYAASGFVGSIAWTQQRPDRGAQFRSAKKSLARSAGRLLPYVRDEKPLRGPRKLLYKLNRALVPRALPDIPAWLRTVE